MQRKIQRFVQNILNADYLGPNNLIIRVGSNSSNK